MKNALRIALALAVGVATLSSAAFADSFQYSYEFADGTVVSGTFDGIEDAGGNTVSSLSNITAQYNGTPFAASGSLFDNCFIAGYMSGCAVASYDGLQTNLVFVDVDYGGGNQPYTEYLMISSFSNSYVQTHLMDQNTTRWEPQIAERWSLVNTTHHTEENITYVPEPRSLTLLSMGLLGFLGIEAMRHRRARNQASIH